MIKIINVTIYILSFLFWASLASSQISDPRNPDLNPDNYAIDNMYFHVGVYYGLSQPVAADLKKISLSGPMDPEIAKIYETVFKTVLERRGLKQYREDDFMETDLFPKAYTNGKTVFVIYKNDSVLEDYLALKKYKQKLIDDGNYHSAARREVATKFAQFFSYSDEIVEEYLNKNSSQ